MTDLDPQPRRRWRQRTPGHPCDTACREASKSDPEQCVCACGGANHGVDAPDPERVPVAAGRDPWARIPEPPADDPF